MQPQGVPHHEARLPAIRAVPGYEGLRPFVRKPSADSSPVWRIGGHFVLLQPLYATRSRARKIEFREAIQGRFLCPVLARKIFFFSFSEKYDPLRYPASMEEGRTRDRHEDVRRGCDGRSGAARVFSCGRTAL